MASRRTRVILVFLVCVLAASLWRTVSVERERRRLADAYAQAQQLVSQLSEERTHLNEELAESQQTVESQAGDLASLRQELESVQQRLEATMTEIASLQQEHQQLRAQNSSLSLQLSSVEVEKAQLEARLSSLQELRLAIRDVKRQMWQRRWAAWRERIDRQREADLEQLASGNRGYVVRHGQSTLGSGPRMHVHVLEPEPQ
jgi:epidermal growth factor receptor substrate 15